MSEKNTKKRESAAAETENAANIKFVGDRIGRKPLEIVRDGLTEIVLPEATIQHRAAFYHPHAARIVRLFPRLYKSVAEKG
jgi:hypothetical protein